MSIAGQHGRTALRAVRRTARSLARPASRFGLTVRSAWGGRDLPRRRAHLRHELDRQPPVAGSERSVTVLVTPHGATAPEVSIDGGAEITVVALDGPPGGGRLTAAAATATTDLLCFLAATSEPLVADWLPRLAGCVDGATVGATALLLHPERPWWRATPDDLLVRESGVALAAARDGGPVAEAIDAGAPPDLTAPVRDVDAVSAACVVLDRSAYLASGGLPPLDDVDAAMVELSARLRDDGGVLLAVPSAAVLDHRVVRSAADLHAALDPTARSWRALVDRTGPLLVRTGRPTHAAATFALTTAAPSARVGPRWGDWHLAEALAHSLRRLGHPARVQTIGEVDEPASRACDVQLVLRGKVPVRRTSGQRHVLWVISHPDLLTTAECDEADLVLVASTRHADALRGRTTTPVAALLQATDTDRFRPVPADPAWSHPVTIVANARHTLRPVVADALAAGLRPAIIGRGWQRLVDPALVVAEQVTNDELSVVYSSAGVVLNDHWADMRANGFVSNRVFDALACAAPLVSDPLPELGELFGSAVATYENVDELRAAVDLALADPEGAASRAAAGRAEIVAHHTFDHRARELLGHLDRAVR